MNSADPEQSAREYTDVAEAAWRWVLDQVRWDDGPWIPKTVPAEQPGTGQPDTDRIDPSLSWERDGVHSGVGGLAQVLAEIRLARAWTSEETDAGRRDRRPGPLGSSRTRPTARSSTAWSARSGRSSPCAPRARTTRSPGSRRLATPDGWPQTFAVPPRFLPDARINDVTLGTAGVLLGALWARRAAPPVPLARCGRLQSGRREWIAGSRGAGAPSTPPRC